MKEAEKPFFYEMMRFLKEEKNENKQTNGGKAVMVIVGTGKAIRGLA